MRRGGGRARVGGATLCIRCATRLHMSHLVDVPAYLQRIRWSGPLAPGFATLQALAAHHAAAIPFENLDPLLGKPVALDLPSLEAKLVRGGRGGYCFEHNTLFAEALSANGFEVTRLAARVLWGRGDDAVTPRSHMLLKIDLDEGPVVADVGFGGLTLTGALRLEADTAQPTPHEPFRLVAVDDGWRMQARVGAEWKSLYRFDLQRQHPIDYEASNWFLSTHPDSRFVVNLIAARAAPDRRFALLNRDFAVHHLDGGTERRRLDSPDEIAEVLRRDFLVALPGEPALRKRLERFFP
jgi:N-hydroxyarylamine O-acetyltransferase